MNATRRIRVAALALAVGLASSAPATKPGENCASVVLWAWERPEDLSFLGSADIAIAYLWGTVRLSAAGCEVLGRRQPLRVPAGARRMPVVRVEVPVPLSATTLGLRRDVLVEVITSAAADADAVQVDFDARHSERGFYADVLRRARSHLPRGTRLSITALASWCWGDPWIGATPVDEAVPMLFRMGVEGPALRARLARGDDIPVEACRSAYGLSTDEPIPRVRPGRTVYLFHPRPWSRDAYEAARARLGATRSR